MPRIDDLFADLGPEFAPVPDRLEVVAGKVVATLNKPNAQQKRFNTLMARIDSEQALAQRLRHCLETHGSQHQHTVHAIRIEVAQVVKRMVLLLDAHIQAPGKPKGLTANQKQLAIRMVLGLCDQLDDGEDQDVQAIAQRYAADDADGEPQSDSVQSLLESYLGDDFAQGRSFRSPEEVLEAAMEHARQQQQAQHAKREARKAQRRAQKGPTAREQAQEQRQLDAQSALPTVYRQLASALHPDRETDPSLRAQKTALMSEVNAAYERQDLSNLLRIQLQSEMVDATKAAQLTEAKLKSLCELLSEQVKALEQDNRQLRQRMEFELGYPASVRFDEDALLQDLQAECAALREDLDQMRAELAQVQGDDKALKTWLKQQAAAHKAQMQAHLSPLDEMLSELMRGR